MLKIKSQIFTLVAGVNEIALPVNRGFTFYSVEMNDLVVSFGDGDDFTLSGTAAFETGILEMNCSPNIKITGSGTVLFVYYY